ncbi:MAG: DNA polymerase I [Bacilli bacterium]|nr:DNA polymerase I [Bacilli bacterium]
MAKKLIVIDGNSLLFRAYYATAMGDTSSIMRTKSGIPTNAIFAFANMMTKLMQGFKGGEYFFVGFDADGHTFRKEQYAEYKANRRPCPEELIPQFPISRELLNALNIKNYEETGIEADDICGTVAKWGSKQGFEVVVYTSDKDYLQLIDENITINLLKTGLSNMEEMNMVTMPEKFGFMPKQIIDYKGLRGDSSDNLPGIPGVGDKTAVKLIQEYGSFEKILEAAETMKSKVGENIRNNKDLGRACYDLATIKIDCELPFTIDDLLYEGYEFEKVSEFAQKYELKQFYNRLPIKLKKVTKSFELEPRIIKSLNEIEIGDEIGLAFDIDYSEYHTSIINGVAIANDHDAGFLMIEDIENNPEFKELMENENIKKHVFDAKATYYTCDRLGIKFKGLENDILLAAYLSDSTVTSNPLLVYASYGIDIDGQEVIDIFNSAKSKTTCRMAFFAMNLKDKILEGMEKDNNASLYKDIELPLSLVLAKMEIEGVPCHNEVLRELGKEFRNKRDSLESSIFDYAGTRFNINSPKQIADVLFKQMGIRDPRGGSTSVEALGDIINEHPIIPLILEYRKYAKMVSTYIEGLENCIDANDKIHTYFNQAQTSTGRLSSSAPNMQNISTRDPESKTIRKAFYYDDLDYTIISFDYSQIELRILAALSNCKAYLDVFNSDEERDVHSETAKRVFGTEEVTSLQRRTAKAVNFAIIYGTTVYGLSDQIHVTTAEAGKLIKSFYLAYPEVGEFLQTVVKDAETQGYVSTMFGRRRYLREVNDPNYAKREAARRQALNAPVQGTAADLMKLVMVAVDKYLSESGVKTQMILQIHDELLFKVPSAELDTVPAKIQEIMETAFKLPVKLKTEMGQGKTWYEVK